MFPAETRVLVIDDMAVLRSVLGEILKKLGFRNVVEAGSAEAAWSALCQARDDGAPFGLVFSDWQMPGQDGISLLRRVRAEKDFENLPFLIVTSEGEQTKVLEAIEAGVSQYIVKPFTVDDVRGRLAKAASGALPELTRHAAPGSRPPLQIGAEAIENAALDAMAQIIGKSLGDQARPVERFVRGAKPVPETQVAAASSFTGPGISGTVILAFEEACYIGLIARFLGKATSEVGLESQDGARELLNIVIGRARSSLATDSFGFKPAIPTAVAGKQVKNLASFDNRSSIHVYKTSFGVFYLEFLVTLQ